MPQKSTAFGQSSGQASGCGGAMSRQLETATICYESQQNATNQGSRSFRASLMFAQKWAWARFMSCFNSMHHTFSSMLMLFNEKSSKALCWFSDAVTLRHAWGESHGGFRREPSSRDKRPKGSSLLALNDILLIVLWSFCNGSVVESHILTGAFEFDTSNP